jgi:hypothetical protein
LRFSSGTISFILLHYSPASIGVIVVWVSTLTSRNLHRVLRLRFHRTSRRARASSGVIVSRIVSQSSTSALWRWTARWRSYVVIPRR